MSTSVFTGVNGQIILEAASLVIERKGFTAFTTHGLKGAKRIPYSSITAVQFKKAGLLRGYIQFSMSGGSESKGGLKDAVKDENSVLFRSSQMDDFLTVKNYVEKRIENREIGATISQAPIPSYTDELTRLGNLLERNLITREEFDEEKSRLAAKRSSPESSASTPSSAASNRNVPMAGNDADEHEMTVLLGIGIMLLPLVFAWLTLRN